MADDILAFESLAHPAALAHVPHEERSAVRKWYERLTGKPLYAFQKARAHAVQTGHTLRQYGESLVVGGILGAAHAELPNGLDLKVGGKEVPLDLAGAAIGAIAGIMAAGSPLAAEASNAGAACATVFAFRKINEHQAAKKLASATTAKPAAGGAAPATTVSGELYGHGAARVHTAHLHPHHGHPHASVHAHYGYGGEDPVLVTASKFKQQLG